MHIYDMGLFLVNFDQVSRFRRPEIFINWLNQFDKESQRALLTLVDDKMRSFNTRLTYDHGKCSEISITHGSRQILCRNFVHCRGSFQQMIVNHSTNENNSAPGINQVTISKNPLSSVVVTCQESILFHTYCNILNAKKRSKNTQKQLYEKELTMKMFERNWLIKKLAMSGQLNYNAFNIDVYVILTLLKIIMSTGFLSSIIPNFHLDKYEYTKTDCLHLLTRYMNHEIDIKNPYGHGVYWYRSPQEINNIDEEYLANYVIVPHYRGTILFMCKVGTAAYVYSMFGKKELTFDTDIKEDFTCLIILINKTLMMLDIIVYNNSFVNNLSVNYPDRLKLLHMICPYIRCKKYTIQVISACDDLSNLKNEYYECLFQNSYYETVSNGIVLIHKYTSQKYTYKFPTKALVVENHLQRVLYTSNCLGQLILLDKRYNYRIKFSGKYNNSFYLLYRKDLLYAPDKGRIRPVFRITETHRTMRSLKYVSLLKNQTTFALVKCCFIDKHLTKLGRIIPKPLESYVKLTQYGDIYAQTEEGKN